LHSRVLCFLFSTQQLTGLAPADWDDAHSQWILKQLRLSPVDGHLPRREQRLPASFLCSLSSSVVCDKCVFVGQTDTC